MLLYLVSDEREPIGIYAEEKRALGAKSLHEKRYPQSVAAISGFEVPLDVYLLCDDGMVPFAAYSTREAAAAAAGSNGDTLLSLRIDGGPRA